MVMKIECISTECEKANIIKKGMKLSMRKLDFILFVYRKRLGKK